MSLRNQPEGHRFESCPRDQHIRRPDADRCPACSLSSSRTQSVRHPELKYPPSDTDTPYGISTPPVKG